MNTDNEQQQTHGQASSIKQTGLIGMFMFQLSLVIIIIISSYTCSVTALAHELAKNKLAQDMR